ncbi:MAG: hypothetical protein K2W95_25655 [Candidatus Obscuribacterales bacterium]|nr:hypothetical protein [Candidatus Obscuribacterales bacterium]
MSRQINFPSELRAGTLFHAERCYCLDDSIFDWLSDAQGVVSVPDEDFVGIVFENNVPLRREILKQLDTNVVKMVYFRNPFELESLMDVIASDPRKSKVDLNPTDDECTLLAKLQGLRAIDLAGAHVTDEGFANLCAITSLESLVVCDTGVTDEGFKHLAKLSNLKELDISLNAITQDCLRYLKSLTSLTELRMSDTAVADEAVPDLTELKSLKFLDVADTAISDEGMERLREALPDCDVWP